MAGHPSSLFSFVSRVSRVSCSAVLSTRKGRLCAGQAGGFARPCSVRRPGRCVDPRDTRRAEQGRSAPACAPARWGAGPDAHMLHERTLGELPPPAGRPAGVSRQDWPDFWLGWLRSIVRPAPGAEAPADLPARAGAFNRRRSRFLRRSFGGGVWITLVSLRRGSQFFGRGLCLGGRGRMVVGGAGEAGVASPVVQLGGVQAASVAATGAVLRMGHKIRFLSKVPLNRSVIRA